MNIAEFQIDRYGPLHRIRETCEGGITVFHGPNESGKTLLLESVLKLLDPGIGAADPRVQRVEESPSGYVVLETADDEVKLGDGTTLPDIAPIEAPHLRNIFTVRDSDLSLADPHAFYDSLTEQIGDLHTSEIEAIQTAFEDRGRLTTKRRNLSSAGEYHHAKDVRDNAVQLADRIDAYIDTARQAARDDTERQLLQTTRKLRRVRDRLHTQQDARTVAEHDRLTDRLETFRETTAALQDRYGYTQAELDELGQLNHEIDTATAEIAEAEEEIASLETTIAETEETLATETAQLEGLERRADAVEEVDVQLEAFREDRTDAESSERLLTTTRQLAVIGLVLGGLAAIAGAVAGSGLALGVAVVLLLVGAISAGIWGYTHRQVAADERRQSQLLEAARDAGFEVDAISEIAPAIEEFRAERETVEDRIDDLRNEIRVATKLLEKHEATIEAADATRERSREERREILEQADVADLDAYRDALEETAALETERSRARQSLSDALGEPDGEPGPDTLISYWEGELAAMVAELDTSDIDPTVYDEETLEELTQRRDELQTERSALEEQLEEHERAIREFATEAREIRADPFIGESITLAAETIDGLEQLQRELEELVDAIERDAAVSRVGLELFDAIHADEEEKITDLFAGDSRATDLFTTIAQDRYVDVAYDPDAQELQVTDAAGETFTPDELSHGTRAQLYFATRVSLGEQLLGNEAGFFILDDAFLPADRRRLQDGFDVLRSLTQDDWQIIYLTAKDEVGVDLVESYDLPCVQLDPLP